MSCIIVNRLLILIFESWFTCFNFLYFSYLSFCCRCLSHEHIHIHRYTNTEYIIHDYEYMDLKCKNIYLYILDIQVHCYMMHISYRIKDFVIFFFLNLKNKTHILDLKKDEENVKVLA